MIWHPVLLAAMAADLLGTALFAAAALTALGLVLKWSPVSADRLQLELEVRSETAVVQARWALAMFGCSSVLLLLGVANIFAGLIPGAMCGTGVVQAMGGNAGTAIVLRCLLLAALLLWNELVRLDQDRPDRPLTPFNARVLLAAAPVLFLALLHTYRAVFSVDAQLPVDCCAVVYDRFQSLAQARRTAGFADAYWTAAFAGLSVVMLAGALGLRNGSNPSAPGTARFAVALLWLMVASVTLVRVLSAYHYGVLHHHCPWCLFLAEHRWVGYPLFAVLAVVAFEALVACVLPKLSVRHPSLRPSIEHRSRKAGGRMLAALLLFLALTALPAIFWRLRFGTWLG